MIWITTSGTVALAAAAGYCAIVHSLAIGKGSKLELSLLASSAVLHGDGPLRKSDSVALRKEAVNGQQDSSAYKALSDATHR